MNNEQRKKERFNSEPFPGAHTLSYLLHEMAEQSATTEADKTYFTGLALMAEDVEGDRERLVSAARELMVNGRAAHRLMSARITLASTPNSRHKGTYHITIDEATTDPEAMAGILEDIAIHIRRGTHSSTSPAWRLDERHHDSKHD